MANTVSSIERLRQLRATAARLRVASSDWRAKYNDRAHYDKQDFGFVNRSGGRDGLEAFSIPSTLRFEAYTGTYGSSSVSRAWSVEQAVIDAHLAAALNVHKQAIFDTIAERLEKEAGELLAKARTELADIQSMLADVEPVSEAA